MTPVAITSASLRHFREDEEATSKLLDSDLEFFFELPLRQLKGTWSMCPNLYHHVKASF